MRKKDLLSQNQSLFDRLNKVQFENASLKRQLADKEREIYELNLKLKESLKQKCEKTESTPLKRMEDRMLSSNSYADFDYAAKVIGEIVVLSANYSNQLTLNGNTAFKELVNLILGRCEIAKSEILSAVSSDCDEATKIGLIDSVKRESEEYFLSVMAQKN